MDKKDTGRVVTIALELRLSDGSVAYLAQKRAYFLFVYVEHKNKKKHAGR